MTGDSLKGFAPIRKQNLKKENIGGNQSLIGTKNGCKQSISKNTDHRQKSQGISVLLKQPFYSGSVNTKFLEGLFQRLAKSRNGSLLPVKKILCMGEKVRKALVGGAGVLQNGNRFTPRRNGLVLFQKFGNEIIINAKGAGHLITGCTFTTSNLLQSRKNGWISIISSSSVQSAIGSFTVNAMSKGRS